MNNAVLIKCLNIGCRKRFPINIIKHPNRKIFYCPFCGTEHKNSYFDQNWKPNTDWHKNKHRSRDFTLADMKHALQNKFDSLKRPPFFFPQLFRNTLPLEEEGKNAKA